ncbi:MAG: HlyD family efflux transporter periplasmic adaptor subunit [Aquificales bacterium]|nr:HlyD family efflux transporter periplasmic adaptor subunit [Aquificales bacterium]
MLKKKGFWIGLIIIVVVAVGGYYAYDTLFQPTAVEAEEAPLQTAVSRRGNITISATGAGTVIPAEEVGLAFSTAGVLEALNVTVGSEVTVADELARLHNTNAQQAVANAELQLQQAAFATDPDATEAGVSLSDIAVEQARIKLDVAQAALDDLLAWEPDEDEIAQAEASLAAANASFSAAAGQESASNNGVTIQQINLDAAQRSLVDAQAAYNTAYDPGREWEFGVQRMADALENERAAADRNLIKAQENLAIAQANLNTAVSGVNYSSSANARSNVLGAEQALATAQTGPAAADIESAEIAVRQAELAWQQALINQQTDALNLAQAQLNLEAAQQTLTDMVLTSPVNGTVMSISATVGENVGTAAFMTLADLETPLLEVYLDESDMNMVGLDFEVEVVFDALPDQTFKGVVVQVDPQLVNEGGVTAVRALVELDSFAKPQTLPVGMNATVEVIGGQAENAVIVPVEALRELSPGEYAIFVMENGEPKMRIVEVGLMDFSFAEILSGLEAGEEVTTGIVQTQ